MRRLIMLLLMQGAFLSSPFLFAAVEIKKDMTLVESPAQLKWSPGPEVLPAGTEIAVLHGNPQESGLYAIRLKFPANFRIPPHWHTLDENITVISGTFYLGMGEKFDQSKGTKLPAGGFASIPAKTGHFAWTTEPTVIQLNNMGPFTIHYYNLADDPRQKK